MKKFKYVFILVLFMMNFSCSQFIDVGQPNDRIVAGTVFTEEGTAIAALNGLYNRISAQSPPFSAGATTMFLGLYSDELMSNYNVSSTLYSDFVSGRLAENNDAVYTNFWRAAYEMIYHANSIITGLENSPISISIKNQLLAETRFVRAFCYWYLISLYGDVPLVLNPNDYDRNAIMPRTPKVEVFNHVINDLTEAKNTISKTYPSAGRYRVNYYTVLALLSRIYTYEGNWQQAYHTANEIITDNVYQQENDLNKIFLTVSPEVIWQTAADAIKWTTEANRFIPTTLATARPNMPLTDHLRNAFEVGDLRKTHWIGNKTVSGTTWYFPYKYKVPSVGSAGSRTESLVMFRLTECYLNRAEAKIYLEDNTAKDDLNLIRNRAGLGNIDATGTTLLEAIHRERRVEFFAEWGMRFFDLRRTGQLDAVIGALKPEWKSTAALFPIPSRERISNPFLVQNPGYDK